MITNFVCKDTYALFMGKRVKRFINIESVAIRKLQLLNAASDLRFLRVPPGNRLEALTGDRLGNTVYASMISGVYVLLGKKVMQ